MAPHVLLGPKTQKNLGVTLQSDLTFRFHIAEKSIKSNKILGGIKHPMLHAPQEANLLAYTSLCRPLLEYADVVWDLSAKCKVHDIEISQNKAIRFIAYLRGREDSVSAARQRLKLPTLEDRWKITACVYLPGYSRLKNSMIHC